MAGMVRFLVVVAVMAITASLTSASAGNVYIAQSSSGASNGADCADAFPVTWFNSAANWGSGSNQIGPGTTVHLCGTFSGAANSTMLSAHGSGASGAPITILFESGANLTSPAWNAFGAIAIVGVNWVVVDGGTNGTIQNTQNGTGLAFAQNSKGVYMSGVNNVTVKNLTIANMCQHTAPTDTTGCNTSGTDDAAIAMSDNGASSSNVTITQNTIHDTNTGIVILLNAGDANFFVTNNTISRTNWGANFGASPGASGPIIFSNNAVSCVVAGECNWDGNGNVFHHNGVIVDPGDGVTMTGMVFSNNYFHDINPSTGHIFIDPSGSGDTPGIQIYNNIFYTTPGQPGPQNGAIAVGIGVSSSINVNNTIVGGGSPIGITVQLTPTVKNNIVVNVQYGELLNAGYTSVSSDYNDFSNLSQGMQAGSVYNGGLAAWQTSTGFDAHSISANPNLSALFTLNAGSPAIGKGTNLSGLGIAGLRTGAPQSFGAGGSCGTGCVPRPSSGAWDMGAFPSGGTSTPAPNPPSGLSSTAH
jgi:hypothetical protein